MLIKIRSENGILPGYETSGSAGMDIKAGNAEKIVLLPGQRYLVPTGLFISLPIGVEAQIRPRSGLAIKHGIGMVNGVGTIDSDYRGEIKIPLINWGQEPFEISPGDRIAQMVISRYEKVIWEISEELDDTDRGQGGFGHTGK